LKRLGEKIRAKEEQQTKSYKLGDCVLLTTSLKSHFQRQFLPFYHSELSRKVINLLEQFIFVGGYMGVSLNDGTPKAAQNDHFL